MSIKFTDFYKKDYGSFHYPFRYPDTSNTKNGLFDWLEIKAFYPETSNEDFVRCYFPHAALFENNKFSTNESGAFGSYNKNTDVAYHFDAVKFANWLRDNYCIPLGVVLISDTVKSAEIDADGIKKLLLESGKNVEADLYIDCTGFTSLLLGEYLQEPFISYNNMLPNNKAWACQVPYKDKEKELEPYTNCTAIENGWCWNIPLWSRIGTGYVFSDKYVSSEKALEEFKNYLMSNKMTIPRTKEEVDSYQYKKIDMRIGIHEKTWVKNVVAIGLSAGFIEPLESNGLFSVIRFVQKLAKSLLREEVSKFDIDIYNIAVKGIYENFAQFVAMHYALSIRRDTNYWIDISNHTFSESLVNMKPDNVVGFFDLHNRKMFTNDIDPISGITYVSVGMNYPLFDKVDQKNNIFNYNIKSYIDSLVENFNNKKIKWTTSASVCLSLNKYLEKNIYNR
jgi:flavin-dependent dehydrogenase